jgi:hypothetical protein
MPELKPLVPPKHPEGPVYRPLSALALIAILLAGIYAATVAILGIAAFVGGIPLILPMWTFVLPIAAAGVAALARLRLRSAEGALGGDALVTWTWRLVVVFGLGFLAYYFMTYLAVRQQAERFTEQFFQDLRDRKLIEAFLMVLEPAQRKHEKASDTGALYQRYGLNAKQQTGALTGFRNNPVVQLFLQGGPETVARSQGVSNWEYESEGFRLNETYVVSNALATAEVRLVLRSRQSKELEGRQWYIGLGELKIQGQPFRSALGGMLEALKQHARLFALDWVTKLKRNDALAMYVDTLPPDQRAGFLRKVRLHEAAELVLSAAAGLEDPGAMGAGWPAKAVGLVFRPEGGGKEYEEFLEGSLVDASDLMAPANIRPAMLTTIKRRFRHPATVNMRVTEQPGSIRPLSPDAAHVTIDQGIHIIVVKPVTDVTGTAEFAYEAELVLESDEGPANATRAPQWRVKEIRLLGGNLPPPPSNKEEEL